jgi:RNA polymerase sigma-70 factor (ECF subfamily)
MILEPPIRDAMLAAIPRLRAFAILLCGSAVQGEELVQETLLLACTCVHSLRPDTNLSTWLFTDLRNHFYLESRRRRSQRSTDDRAETMISPPTQFVPAKNGEFVNAFAKLQPTLREALILIEASGLSHQEAAQICGCQTSTITRRLNRARADIAQLLAIESI